ncbi:alpha/beta fold hydrolase [Azospirillum griseum]|uniref:Alpha/beta hydrolase n=1 Tax=Azospirillum griseum TaxID=2496639 RepID=A0A3S0I0R4_9PROT|nr:alpha/beta hydrolase [Azospirillum griseum]RTR24418.1 alpha/beta hydrolase [Azospirillum griseum]
MADPVFDTLRLRDGTTLRWARWQPTATPPRGTVLILTGRAEFIEKYTETAHGLTARGFQALAFDWRNQGLSDRPLANRQIHHLADFTTLVDDLDELVARVARPCAGNRPLVLLAHSMGGLVATLFLSRHAAAVPAVCDAVILSAPMHAIHFGPLPRVVARALAGLAVALGWGERYAPGQGDYDPAEGRFTPDNPITSDPQRYAAFHGPYTARPELRVGGVSYGWIAAALRAEDAVVRDLPLERVTVPVLLLSAPGDRVVRADAHRRVATRLGHATLVEHPEARHELLMERDAIRDRVWADIDAFLNTTLASGGDRGVG